MVSRQKSTSSSSSRDEVITDQQPVSGGGEGSVVSDGVQLSLVSDSHSPAAGMGMEDSGFGSGFGTGESWRSTEQGDHLEPQSPATGSGKEGNSKKKENDTNFALQRIVILLHTSILAGFSS